MYIFELRKVELFALDTVRFQLSQLGPNPHIKVVLEVSREKTLEFTAGEAFVICRGRVVIRIAIGKLALRLLKS